MKIKTHKATVKRVRKTGSGKIQQPTTSASHLRHNKSSAILARAKKYKIASKGNTKRLAKLIPYL